MNIDPDFMGSEEEQEDEISKHYRNQVPVSVEAELFSSDSFTTVIPNRPDRTQIIKETQNIMTFEKQQQKEDQNLKHQEIQPTSEQQLTQIKMELEEEKQTNSQLKEQIKLLEETHKSQIQQLIQNADSQLREKGSVGSLLKGLSESEALEQAGKIQSNLESVLKEIQANLVQLLEQVQQIEKKEIVKKLEEFVQDVTSKVMQLEKEKEQRDNQPKSVGSYQLKYESEIKGQVEEQKEAKEAAFQAQMMPFTKEEMESQELICQQQTNQKQPLPQSSMSSKTLDIQPVSLGRENTLNQQSEQENKQILKAKHNDYSEMIKFFYEQKKHEILSHPIPVSELLKEVKKNNPKQWESQCKKIKEKQIQLFSKQRYDTFGFLRSFGISYFLTKSALLNRTKSTQFKDFLDALKKLDIFELQDLDIFEKEKVRKAFPSLIPLDSQSFSQFLQNYFTEKTEQWCRSSDPVADIVQSLSDPVMDQSLQFMIRKLLIHAVKELYQTILQSLHVESILQEQVINNLKSMKNVNGDEEFFIIASTFMKCRLMIFNPLLNNDLFLQEYLPKEQQPNQKNDPSIFDLSDQENEEQSISIWFGFDGQYNILYSPQQQNILQLESENSVFKQKLQQQKYI